MFNITNSSLNNANIRVLKKEGKGLLLKKDGQRVLMVKGSPYEMGYQHGKLLKEDVATLAKEVIYKIEDLKADDLKKAWNEAEKHIPERYKQELKGLADGADISPEDVELLNIFSELFHCSGIALYGEATLNEEFYHARILDYMTEYNLQNYSVVIIAQPNGYNTYINAGLAGIIGSVTGMNIKKVAFGEMGGKGEGDWDGLPMTLLMRKGLEEAHTLKQAVEIFKKEPRTCEYYYLISDVKSTDARILYCTPNRFITLKPEESHPSLPKPQIKDTLVISGEDRYRYAQENIKKHYGKIDKDLLIEIMKRPVSMKSNLHNAIFLPNKLKMWLTWAANDVSKPKFQSCYQPYYEYSIPLFLKFYKNQFTRNK